MDGFLVKDSLTVLTQNGECQIQLCLGDITRLKRKDKVDVILISAFRGDYAPTPTSVIGALLRNLKIHVRELSRDKEEDLRKLYHCWWSKPLPDDKPYNRLMCFETNLFGSRRPQELVGDVFRCLVPVLNNQDGTVITPLLNTGDQGFGRVVMLEGMVEAAVNWMKAGLPLRMLKIVLYCQGKDDDEMERIATRDFHRVLESFEELKGRYMMQDLTPKEITIDFDVYLSFSKHDAKVVDLITDKLRSNKSDVRIFDSRQVMNADSVWQQDMYEVMMHSARVITVLTPNYLQCTACVEQYNIAMCCSRKAMRNMLAPFYIEESTLPTYMTQVQYVDCRSSVTERVGEACHQIIISLSVTLKAKPQMDPSIQYDVFVSYSHADSERANHIVATLKRLNPDLRLFFDIQELKTGSAWQRTLYHSIDGTRVMLALISNKYLASAVCQEEYNLALAKHCSQSGSLKLVPMCIEDVYGVTAEFTKVKMVNAKGGNFQQAVDTTCTAVVDWLAGQDAAANGKEVFGQDEDLVINTDAVTENLRKLQFKYQHGDKSSLLRTKSTFPTALPKSLPTRPKWDKGQDEASKCDVAFSYAAEDEKYAEHLAAVLSRVKGVVVKTKAASDHERLALMDQAKHVVAFLSPHYVDCMEKSEEFNIALSRQRLSTSRILFPVQVHTLPQRPTYFHLVPFCVNAADNLWPELCSVLKVDVSMHVLERADNNISKPTELALHEAACQILLEIQRQRTIPKPPSDEVKALPTLLNVKKLQSQVDHAFTTDTDVVGEYLLSLSLNEGDSTDMKKNESKKDPPPEAATGQSEPDQTGSKQPDTCIDEPALTGSQPVSTGSNQSGDVSEEPVRTGSEEWVRTGSVEPVRTSSEEPVRTGSKPAEVQAASRQLEHMPKKENENNSRNEKEECSHSNIVRMDGTRKRTGSASCSVV
ncbi:uncharacterized protein LOC119734684 [Patiria miniata]|uniref:ADP-ribosyl cyclase/cyclic ADP-ribose hydrolase n=1 Tax=Patiria miniata TaxID=46514 RepID=A0A914AL30_PATMI|nr:uncharacterized protein LOC119734684 [Patiria miniata]XP_038064141.1 uncharacterized protein LOC119734684 [Patiria miniata]